jgi:hypothetical protein
MHINGVRGAKRVRIALVAGVLLACAMLGVGLIAGSSSSARGARTYSTRSMAGEWRAGAAGTETLNESVSLRVNKLDGNDIAGQGRASGTIAGSGSAHLTLVNGSHASGEFTSSSSHGSVTARFSASYRTSGELSYFTGSVTGVRGSGRYARASSAGIKFSGVLNRVKLTLTLSATGKWHS